jgi:hypothetical protein
MEAVLVRQDGYPDHVRIGRSGGPVAFVISSPDQSNGSVCQVDLWNEYGPTWAGWVQLDRSGEVIARSDWGRGDEYWHGMPWFGWLMDLAVDAGLELGEG